MRTPRLLPPKSDSMPTPPTTLFHPHPMAPPAPPAATTAVASMPVKRNPRRTPYDADRIVPTLHRQERELGDEGRLGDMILESMGIAVRASTPPREVDGDFGTGSFQSQGDGGNRVNHAAPGMQNGWMVMGVAEDNGSQFTNDTQGSTFSQASMASGQGDAFSAQLPDLFPNPARAHRSLNRHPGIGINNANAVTRADGASAAEFGSPRAKRIVSLPKRNVAPGRSARVSVAKMMNEGAAEAEE